MDPSQEIFTQRPVDLDKKPGLDCETGRRHSPTSNSAVVSKVLDADDLLIEILLRLGFPTTLVRAAAVCRRWLHHASDHGFMRRFRELHHPRLLLGFYVNPWRQRTTPRFVYGATNATMFSRADDAANLYLVHLKEFQICVWLRNIDHWLLVDNICLRDMCASLTMLRRNAYLQLKHVGDNAEFVFLHMDPYILFWDVKRGIVRKVYEMTKEDEPWSNIFPFTMIWPPKFPKLKDDPARFAS